MWEFSLNLDNTDLANYIFSSIKNLSNSFGGIVTSTIEKGHTSILIGVEKSKRSDVEDILSRVITQIICTYYKSSFLDKYLFLPHHDQIGVVAFKKALLNFDRETDYFIIQKALSFDKDLYLDSFYEFKLKNLKAKWTELVALANENRDYLISSEAFLDLLKFLVDNLDICEDEVNVFEEENGYKICLESQDAYDNKYHGQLFNEEGLISSIIDLSPQKINIHCHSGSKTTDFLEKIYEKRICVKTECTCTNFKQYHKNI